MDREKGLEEQPAIRPTDALGELVAKIRLHRGIHEACAERAELRHKALQILNVVGSSLITLVAFADFGVLKTFLPSVKDPQVMLGVGTAGFILFLANALAHVFSLGEVQAKHRRSVEMYSELLRDLRKSQADSMSEEARSEVLQQFQDRFMDLHFASITVVGSAFDEAEARYVRRSLLRMARRDHPFAPPWRLKGKAEGYKQQWERERRTL